MRVAWYSVSEARAGGETRGIDPVVRRTQRGDPGIPPDSRPARRHYVPCGASRCRSRYRLASANAVYARVVFFISPR
jgi:hypothetical protein